MAKQDGSTPVQVPMVLHNLLSRVKHITWRWVHQSLRLAVSGKPVESGNGDAGVCIDYTLLVSCWLCRVETVIPLQAKGQLTLAVHKAVLCSRGLQQ